MFQKMTIKQKLFFLIFLPIVLILVLSAYLLEDMFKNYNQVKSLDILMKFNTNEIAKVMVDVQKERGYSVAYISNDGKKFRNRLLAQRVKVDKDMRELKHYLMTHNIEDVEEGVSEECQQALRLYSRINEIRSKVDNLQINVLDVIDYYSSIDKKFLDTKYHVLQYTPSEELQDEVVRYYDLLEAMEEAGKERAYVAYLLSKNKLSSNILTRWNGAILIQNRKLKEYKDLKNYLGSLETEIENIRHHLAILRLEHIAKHDIWYQ